MRAAAKSPAIPAPAIKPVRRSYSQIEVGMTRQDVDLFRRDGTSNTAVRRSVGVGTQTGPAVVDESQVAGNETSRTIAHHRIIPAIPVRRFAVSPSGL